MADILAPITADSLIASAKRLGLRIVSEGRDVFFNLEERTANPAGIAAIMREPHLARANFGRAAAMKAAGAELVGGLCFGFDVPKARAPNASEEFKAYAAVGRETRWRMEHPE